MNWFHSYRYHNNNWCVYQYLYDAREHASKGDIVRLYNFGKVVHEEII